MRPGPVAPVSAPAGCGPGAGTAPAFRGRSTARGAAPLLALLMLVVGWLAGCGPSQECEMLRDHCTQHCQGAAHAACLEIVEAGDEELCSAAWRTYREHCPTWSL